MTNPYQSEPEPKRPTEGTDFVALLDPETFSRTYPDYFKRIYKVDVKLLGGTPINPKEYILVDAEHKLSFMSGKGQFRLYIVTALLRNPVVTVKKYRASNGIALVLLTADEDLDSLYDQTIQHKIRAVSEQDPSINGYVKPGGQGREGTGQDGNTNTLGRGQDGNTNTLGRGQGYPNCLGFSFPGLTPDQHGFLNEKNLSGTGTHPWLKVAVLDSGVDYRTKPTQQPTDENGYQQQATGWDFVDDDAYPDDTQYNRHGTRVGSIIRVLCPEANLIPVRIADSENRCTLYDVLSGLEYAAQQRVQLINASWVFPTYGGIYIPLLQASLRRLAYRGILLVCSAGNIGPVPAGQLDTIPHIGESRGDLHVPMLSPACSSAVLDSVITVTSVAVVPRTFSEKPGHKEFGQTRLAVCELRSRRFVTVGVLVNGESEQGPFGSFITPSYNPFRGTSFAAPYVTGQLARAIRDGKGMSSRRAALHAIGATRDRGLRKQIHRGLWIEADLPHRHSEQ